MGLSEYLKGLFKQEAAQAEPASPQTNPEETKMPDEKPKSTELPREGIDFQYKVAYADGLSNFVRVFYMDKEAKIMTIEEAVAMPFIGTEFKLDRYEGKAEAIVLEGHVGIKVKGIRHVQEVSDADKVIEEMIQDAEKAGVNLIESSSPDTLRQIKQIHFDRYKEQILHLGDKCSNMLKDFLEANPRFYCFFQWKKGE